MLLYAACTTFAWSCACLLRVDGDALASWYNVYHSPTIPISLSLSLHCSLPTTLAPSLHLRHVVAVVPRRLLADSACGLRVFCEASAEPEDWLKETLWCKKNWQTKITKRWTLLRPTNFNHRHKAAEIGAIMSQPPPGFGTKPASAYIASLDVIQKAIRSYFLYFFLSISLYIFCVFFI